MLFSEIEQKISNTSYIYLIQSWNNVNIYDDREIYKYIAKLIYENLSGNSNNKEYWYFITAMMKYKHHITNLVDYIYTLTQDHEFIINLFNYELYENKYSAEELLEYYQQLLIDEKYILIAFNASFNYHFNSKEFISTSFVSRVIKNIFSSTSEYETCISIASNLVHQIMNISFDLKIPLLIGFLILLIKIYV